jgi:hypothetical protein
MVERTESKGFDEFEGQVAKVEEVESSIKADDGGEARKQYKIHIATIPASLTKSGMMYTWIGIPQSAKGDSIPNGSVIDAYIRALERLDSQIKKLKTHKEVFGWMEGKKFQFNREQLGKAYKGHPPADYWIPVRVLSQ